MDLGIRSPFLDFFRRGEVARDELTAAKKMGKQIRFIPADMNHQIARDRAFEERSTSSNRLSRRG